MNTSTFDIDNDTAADYSAAVVKATYSAARTAARRAEKSIDSSARKLGSVLNSVHSSGVAAAFYADTAEEETTRNFDEESRDGSVTRFGREELGLSAPRVSQLRKYSRIVSVWEAGSFGTATVREGTVRSIPADASDADVLAVRERIASDHDDKATASTVRAACEELGLIEAPETPADNGEEQTTTDEEEQLIAAANLVLANWDDLSPTLQKKFAELTK